MDIRRFFPSATGEGPAADAHNVSVSSSVPEVHASHTKKRKSVHEPTSQRRDESPPARIKSTALTLGRERELWSLRYVPVYESYTAEHTRKRIKCTKEHEVVRKLGTVDPCTKVCNRDAKLPTIRQCKLWHTHAPMRPGGCVECKFVLDTRQRLLDGLSSNGSYHRHRHYAIASLYKTYIYSVYRRDLDSVLKPWCEIRGGDDALHVLEALVDGWIQTTRQRCGLNEVGDSDSIPKTMGDGFLLGVNRAQSSPKSLIRFLVQYKKNPGHQMPLRSLNALSCADNVLLDNGWWSEDDPSRHDVLVNECVYMHMCDGSDEYIKEAQLYDQPIPGKSARSPLTQKQVRDSVHRMAASNLGAIIRFSLPTQTPAAADIDAQYALTTRPVATTCSRVMRTANRLHMAQVCPDARAIPPRADLRQKLNAEQRLVYDAVVVDGYRLVVLNAPGGTGKTFTVSVIAEAFASADCVERGNSVLCLAPTHKALGVLRDKLAHVPRCQFATVQSVVLEQDIRSGLLLLVVDEMSMLTMAQINRLFELYGAVWSVQLVFLGDVMQLPCIGLGWPFRNICEIDSRFGLVQSMRTNSSDLGQALSLCRQGRVPDLLRYESVRAGVVTIQQAEESTDEQCANMAAELFVAGVAPWQPDYVQIITPGNKQVDLVNEYVQTRLGTNKNRAFGGWKGCCHQGDLVRFTANLKRKSSEQRKLADAEQELKEMTSTLAVARAEYKDEKVHLSSSREPAEIEQLQSGVCAAQLRVCSACSREGAEHETSATARSGFEYANGDCGWLRGFVYEAPEGTQPRKQVALVELQRGGVVKVRNSAHISPAYACTVHKLQGSEFDHAVFLVSNGTSIRQLTNEMVYTGVSRAQRSIRISGNARRLDICTPERRNSLYEHLDQLGVADRF